MKAKVETYENEPAASNDAIPAKDERGLLVPPHAIRRGSTPRLSTESAFPAKLPPPSLPRFRLEGDMNAMASYRLGRVLLHALCLLRHPAHSRWHWCGILRELKA